MSEYYLPERQSRSREEIWEQMQHHEARRDMISDQIDGLRLQLAEEQKIIDELWSEFKEAHE